MELLRQSVLRVKSVLLPEPQRLAPYTRSDSEDYQPRTRLGELGQSTRNFTQVLVIIIAAVLLGASGGLWIAGDNVISLKFNRVALYVARILDRPEGREPAKATQGTEAPPATIAPETPGANPAQQPVQAPPSPHSLPSIDNIRYSYQKGVTTIDVDLGMSSLVRAARLHDPERIFFDLQNAQQKGVSVPEKEQKVENIDDAVLSSLRLAPRGGGELRIVLDVKQSCDFTYRQVAQPTPRLTIELRPATAGNPSPH